MSIQPASDTKNEDLWEEVCAQSEGAIERLQGLIKEVCPVVFRRAMVPSSERERLLDDVLVSVWNFARDQNAAPTNLRAFLKWRARGVLKTFERELDVQRRQDPLEISFPIPEGGTLQLDVAVMKEISKVYSRCREQLAPIYSAVWTSRFERDLGPEATAQELGIAVGTVAVRLHRAKDLLMECLTAGGVFR